MAELNCYSQTSGGLPPVKITPRIDQPQQENNKPKAINPSVFISDGWKYFIGENNYVDEKKAYDYTLAAINLLDDSSSNKRILSIAKNNLLVIYSCSLNKSVRNILQADNYPQDYIDSNSIDNLIWAVFLQRKTIASDKIAQFYKIVREEHSTHMVNKYWEQLKGIAPNTIESAYVFLKQQAENGDAEASMRYGYAFECGFETTNLDEAIKWFSKARELYAKDPTAINRLKSIEDRIKRLELIKQNKFNNQ